MEYQRILLEPQLNENRQGKQKVGSDNLRYMNSDTDSQD